MKKTSSSSLPDMPTHTDLPVMDDKMLCPRNRPFRRSRPFLGFSIAAMLLYTLYIFAPLAKYADSWKPAKAVQDAIPEPATTKSLVPFEAHIMSKCPDARDCLQMLVLPAMIRIYEKVNFTLSYIGTPTDSNDGVACKHGPAECMGNILELCAAELYPDPKIYLGFTMCLSRQFSNIPDRNLVEDCALEHAIDFQKLNDCATQDDGAYGVSLLRNSVQLSSAVGICLLPSVSHEMCRLQCSLSPTI
jgi:hypothetical protein